ncbi:hypothetical protein HYX70_01330 [Candidatus Saccharibacteria bacterium]|nr:hypothetical protein [Candidatus Saccharibacteria bacterium]
MARDQYTDAEPVDVANLRAGVIIDVDPIQLWVKNDEGLVSFEESVDPIEIHSLRGEIRVFSVETSTGVWLGEDQLVKIVHYPGLDPDDRPYELYLQPGDDVLVLGSFDPNSNRQKKRKRQLKPQHKRKR